MEEKLNFKTVLTYILLMLFMLVGGTALSQNMCNSDICVVQFNAGWNEANGVDYLDDLKDCSVMNVNIEDGTYQADYDIVVVPTIIVFNGKEVERFHGNIMMKIEATRKEVQSVVDEIIYSDF